QREKSSDWSVRSSTKRSRSFSGWVWLTRAPRDRVRTSHPDHSGRAEQYSWRLSEATSRSARRRRGHAQQPLYALHHLVRRDELHAAEVPLGTLGPAVERAGLAGLVAAQHHVPFAGRREAQLGGRAAEQRHDAQAP